MSTIASLALVAGRALRGYGLMAERATTHRRQTID